MKKRPTARQVLMRFRNASPEARDYVRRELKSGLNSVKEFGHNYYKDWSGEAERLLGSFLELLAEPEARKR